MHAYFKHSSSHCDRVKFYPPQKNEPSKRQEPNALLQALRQARWHTSGTKQETHSGNNPRVESEKHLELQPRSTSVWKLHVCCALTNESMLLQWGTTASRGQFDSAGLRHTERLWDYDMSCTAVPSFRRKCMPHFKHFSYAANPTKMPWMTAMTQLRNKTLA